MDLHGHGREVPAVEAPQPHQLAVVTGAWPNRRFPAAGCFIRSLTQAMAMAAAGGEMLSVVAPGPDAPDDPQCHVVRFANPVGRPKLTRPNLCLGLLYLLSAAATCRRVFKKTRPQAVLLHWVLPLGPAVLAALRMSGLFGSVPLLVWAHGSDLAVYPGKSRLFRWLAIRTLKAADRVWTVSEDLKKRAQALGAPAGIEVLPMGVAGHFKSAPPADSQHDPFQVLFVGDLIPEKGILTLLRSFRAMPEGAGLELCVVGDGPLRDRVRQSGARHFPSVPGETVRTLLDLSSVLVLPSRSEGAPLAVMEALSRGVPVVASRVGGIPEWVTHGRSGLLLDQPDDSAALSRCLLDLKNDPRKWEALRRGASAAGRRVRTVREVADCFWLSLQETRHALRSGRTSLKDHTHTKAFTAS